MDDALKQLAAVSGALDRLEAAVDEAAWTAAREALVEADAGLAALRERWRAAEATERTVLGRLAPPLRRRRDALAVRVPPVRALGDARPEHDPEQDADPEDGQFSDGSAGGSASIA